MSATGHMGLSSPLNVASANDGEKPVVLPIFIQLNLNNCMGLVVGQHNPGVQHNFFPSSAMVSLNQE